MPLLLLSQALVYNNYTDNSLIRELNIFKKLIYFLEFLILLPKMNHFRPISHKYI